MIAACLKWVDDNPDVDPLSGAVRTDARTSGPSDADRTALEWALRLGEAWSDDVVAVTAGPAAAEPVLREALAAGASSARRADLALGAPSERVAAALDAAIPSETSVIMCGTWSADRGSGAVPAFLAAHRRAAQALGLVSLSLEGTTVAAERRLDGGRRERLRVTAPMVLSVEPGARLRRAGLAAVLQANEAAIEVIAAPAGVGPAPAQAVRSGPFRPRARQLASPAADLSARERILALTGALVERDPPRLVHLDPAVAADELLAQLEAWGYR